MLARTLLAALVIAPLLLIACGGDDGGDDETPTPVASVTARASPAATVPAGAIREVDLENAKPVVDLLDEAGGTFEQTDVLYADLTDDGVEEAVVPLASDGTLGFVAFTVLTLANEGSVEAILTLPEASRGVSVSVDDGQLVAIEPVPGPDDPECCPSQIRTTVYAWDGNQLAVESEQTTPNPQGGAKTPVVSP